MQAPQHFNEWLTNMNAGVNARPLLRFILYFLGSFLLLQWAYQAVLDTPAYHFFIDTLTVRPSVDLIHLLLPEDAVRAQGHRLLWSGGGLSVYNGCDGAEVMQLLLAAFVAVAGPWRQRLIGAAFGLLLIYALNQGRIVALYFAARHDRVWFELLHGLVGPLFIIALTTLFFAWWTGRDEIPRAA